LIHTDTSARSAPFGIYQAMHQRAVARLDQLQQQIDEPRAQLRLRERQLFECKSEKGCSSPPSVPTAATAAPAKRPRGQQRGWPSPPPRCHDHLLAQEETLDVPAARQRCPACGQPWLPFPGTDDAQLLEIDVRAYRRVYRRRRYRPGCTCGAQPGIITAPPPPKLIPRSPLGLSVWVTLLLDKYRSGRPTYHLLDDSRTQGLDLSLGTITDALRRLARFLQG